MECGVFETIKVDDGTPLRVDQHLTRLAGSVGALYHATLPQSLERDIRAAARRCGNDVALRVTVVPAGTARIHAAIERRVSPARVPPTHLRAVTVPGGLGSYKWRDRRLLEDLGDDGGTPLILDVDGSVLEAAWANVFIVRGREWATPQADGRLLPGVTRGALINAAQSAGHEVALRRLSLSDVTTAEAILLTSALALVTWATIAGSTGDHARAANLAAEFHSKLLGGTVWGMGGARAGNATGPMGRILIRGHV
jgi:para-aminobenzoate synthetase/4-amino-4-deoxychorismate lyase